MNLIVAEQLLKFGAGEEIEIPLAPVCTPGIALASGGFHFRVGVSDVDDEFRDAGFEMVERVSVEVIPFGRRNGGIDGDDAIDDDVIWTEPSFEIGKIGEPISRGENGKIVFVSDAQDDFEKILVGLKEAILVRIEMRGFNAHGERACDLRAKFRF